MNNYRIYYEPVDIRAEDLERAQRLLKYCVPTVSRIVVVDKDGFAIK